MSEEHPLDMEYRAAALPVLSELHNSVKLGCRRTPQSVLNRLPRFEAYLGADPLPAYPALTTRRRSVSRPWDMLGNDQQGDCFFAMAGHMELLASSVTGAPTMLSAAETLAKYHQCTGVGDNGTDPVQGMNFWQQQGMAGKLLGWAKVSLSSSDTLKHAIDLFGAVGWGMNLPAAWKGQQVWKGPTGPMPTTGPWAPGSWGLPETDFAGHIIPLVDYDAQTFYAVSWGDVVAPTFQAIQDYGMIAVVPITPFWFDKSGLTPEQFDLATLQYDLAALSGGPLPPKPAPKPVPPPIVVPPIVVPPIVPPAPPDSWESLASLLLTFGGHKTHTPVAATDKTSWR